MPTPEQAAHDLELLGRRLKTADKQLRKDLLREIRTAGKPTIEDIRASALATLPNRGGLANRVGKDTKFGTRTRTAGRSAGVQIRSTGGASSGRTLKSLDEEGTWRHPLFGNRKVWVGQSDGAAEGWFTEPIEDDLPRFRKAVLDAMEKTANEIVRGI